MNAAKSCLVIPLIGVLGALFCLTPSGIYLEQEYGLQWLFKMRGEITPSEKVVIIAIDRHSVDVMNLPEDPERWPRSYYAQLIDKVNLYKPAVIGVNLTFNEARDPVADQMLVDVMQRGQNIVLSNYIKQQAITSAGTFRTFVSERIVDPIPVFEQSALAVAPFLLPKTPAVKQIWTRKKSAGDISTFPAIIFHCFVFKQALPEMTLLLQQLGKKSDRQFTADMNDAFVRGDVAQIIKLLQQTFAQQPQALAALHTYLADTDFEQATTRLLEAWLGVMSSAESVYLNHYGKTGSITTLPFYQVLDSSFISPDEFKDKVVLIGFADDLEPERNRGLYTVYSDQIGAVVSPVEIAATAIANMIENSWLKPLPAVQQVLLILCWGILLASVAHYFTYRSAVVCIVLLMVIYLSYVLYVFKHHEIWLPIVIPLLIQSTLILALSTYRHTRRRHHEHQKMHNAFSQYLPNDVIKSVIDHHDDRAMNRYGEVTRGLCLATDAGQYTSLSESMPPEQLSELMNAYYSHIFSQVKKHHGMVSDIIGDAMMAIWAKQSNSLQIRRDACLAALQIQQAIEHFNMSQPHQLPTRLSLHYGEMRIGNVGAVDHYEYRAVGDTVNTASRIEGVNKLLNTKILVSAEVIRELPEFFVRDLGMFILKGKKNAVHLYELVGFSDSVDADWRILNAMFVTGLELFKEFQWQQALQVWQEVLQRFPSDGPTLFYIQYIQRNLSFSAQTLIRHKQDRPRAVVKIESYQTGSQ